VLLGCTNGKIIISSKLNQKISGRVIGISSFSSLSVGHAALACPPAVALLYKINSAGSKIEPALGSTTIAADGSYSFSNQNLLTPLIVSINNCNAEIFYRPVTGAKNQDVSFASSMLGYMLSTNQKNKLFNALQSSPSEIESLIQNISSSSMALVYDRLINNSIAKAKFNNIFGVNPDVLEKASPEVIAVAIPSNAQELSSMNLSVISYHWLPTYDQAYSWTLDGVVVGSSDNVSWAPSANSQGQHDLALVVGENDGTGLVNLAGPVKTVVNTLSIPNNVFSAAPSFTVTTPLVVGATPINTRTITVTLDKSSGPNNCEMFSQLALVENNAVAPPPESFNINCTTSGVQTVFFNLASTGDGMKNLRLWAKDASGVISTAPSTFSLYLDTGIPTVTLTNTNSLTNSSSQSFTFTGTDSGGTIDHFECRIDTGAFAVCSSPQNNTSLIEGDHTFSVRSVDTAGNVSSTSSKTWHIDLTAPILTLSGSPSSVTNELVSFFTFAATDTGGGVVSNYECSEDGGAYAFCISPFMTSFTAGSHTLDIRANDSAGNISLVQSFSWTIDTTPPIVAVTTPATNGVIIPVAQVSNFSVAGTCSENTRSVQLAGPSTASTTCTSGSWSTNIDVSLISDGVLSLTAIHTDLAGNSTTSTARTFIKDTLSPAITITTPLSTRANGAYGNVSWFLSEEHVAASTSFTVELFNGSAWVSVGSKAAIAGVNSNQKYTLSSFSVPNVNIVTAKIRVSFTDAAGNSASVESGTFIIENTPPTISSFTVNGGLPNSTNSNIPITFQAASTMSNIDKLCFKKDSSVPLETDSCWTYLASYGIASAKNINVTSMFYNIGLASGTYTIYIWVGTQAGLMSSLSNAGAGTNSIDKGSLTYTAPIPPIVTKFQLTSTDTPASPPAGADLVAGIGQSVYIKWSITSAVGLEPTAPINIYSATDDSNYTLMSPSGVGLINGVNGTCTVPAGYTGCAELTSPSNSFFRIKMKVVDSQGSITFTVSNPMNSAPMKYLAGNTDLGIGGSAKSAIIRATGGRSLAVLDDGRIFVADVRGLAIVNPTTGVYEILIPTTGSSSADGPITNATLQGAGQVYVDFQQNLLIVDGYKVRRINTHVSPMTITTLIGGGGDSSDSINGGLNFGATSPFSPLYLMPNGDIWFFADPSFKIRTYHAATDQITTIHPSGNGNSFSDTIENALCPATGYFFASFDAATQSVDNVIYKVVSTRNAPAGVFGTCPFGATGEWQAYVSIDPTTGAAFLPAPLAIRTNATSQGLDSGYRDVYNYLTTRSGDVYGFIHGQGVDNRLYKFIKASKSWTPVAGSGDNGTCADGTLISDCPLSAFNIAFNTQGQFFYIDGQLSVIRTVDSENKVRTLAGDKLGSEDGRDPLLTRFGGLTDVKIWSNAGVDHFVAFDYVNSRIRGFIPGQDVTTVAGTQRCSLPDLINPAATQGIVTCQDGNSSRLVIDKPTGDIYFPRIGNMISKIVRSTGKWVDILQGGFSYGPGMLGINNNYVLLADRTYWGRILLLNPNDSTIFPGLYNVTTPYGGAPAFCPEGTPLTQCSPWYTLGDMQAVFDSVTSQWVIWNQGDGRIVSFSEMMTGNLATFATVPRIPKAGIALKRSNDLVTNKIMYCSGGKLYRYDLNTSVETELAMSLPSMTCIGHVEYSPVRNSLIFTYLQNDLNGIAEYLNP
jgi:hypothetical protein